MRIDQQLKALQGNRALQRRLQAQIEQISSDWRNSRQNSALDQELERYAQGIPLGKLPKLSNLMRSHSEATRFVESLCDAIVSALAEAPLAQIPLRHSFSKGFLTIRIAGHGSATLSLLCYERRDDLAEPVSATFADQEQHEIVVAGIAEGLLHSLDKSGRIRTEAMTWRPGDYQRIKARRMSRHFLSVPGSMVMLQLARIPKRPAPTRELALESGALIHQACGDKSVSQSEMALAVLGAMQRKDAVPAMAVAAMSGPAHLRWEAIRQTLSIDPVEGMRLLSNVASDPEDQLRPPAHQLREKLVQTYPQLLQEQVTPCPA